MKESSNPLLFAIIFMIVAAILGGFFTLFFEGIATKGEAVFYPQNQTIQTAEDPGITTAEVILPSVVGIRATEKTTVNGINALNESSGSGVILSRDGYIITNHHVIADGTEISVVFTDQSETKAEIIGTDRHTDLALLKIEKDGLTPAVLSNERPQVGQTAYAVGNPGGQEFAGTVTKGIVSGLDRTLVTEGGDSFLLIQTDAAINPGNSGGALCNAEGEVIGINVLKINESGFEGMGFAIPTVTVKDIAAELKERGTVRRGSLGVYLLCNVTEGVAEAYNVGIDHGVLIGLRENGAAEKAGLKDYDVITAFNGEVVNDMYDLQLKVFALDPGDRVTITVFRNGKNSDYTITLEELKEE